MPYGLKRRLEIEAERKKKREEKARLKAEKEKEKKKEKAHQKKLKTQRRCMKKLRAKRKAEKEAYRKSVGEEIGYYYIYYMVNGKRVKKKQLFYSNSKLKAQKEFYRLVEENKSTVMFPQTVVLTHKVLYPRKYEILLVQKLKDDKYDNVTMIRDNDGKFMKNYFSDSTEFKILDKSDWLVEEEFNVYGYDSNEDRKDFNFIMENIIKAHTDQYTRVIAYGNKLIHHYDDDLDIIICKSIKQAEELYDKVESVLDKKKYPTVFFMGKVQKNPSSWLIDDIQKKTGWEREKIRHLKMTKVKK